MSCNAERFAAKLAETWVGVSYNPKTRSGFAHVPGAGDVHFHEAGSDPAVIVNVINLPRFKGDEDGATAFIKALRKATSNSD